MFQWSSWIIPLVFLFIIIYGLLKGVDVFETFLEGVKEGLSTVLGMFPALLILMTCVSIFKASGALELLTKALLPISKNVGLPTEVLPLVFLRPLSGSGALVVFQDILLNNGPDSLAGKVASVIMGSTETTFYTVALYYGAARVTKTRHTIPSAAIADLTGFLVSGIVVQLLLR